MAANSPWPWAALLVVLQWGAVDALGAAPTLTRVFPPGGQRGSTTTVTLNGKFEWPVNVWAPGVDVKAGMEAGKLELSIPADLPTDRVWLRLYNAEGASASVPFLVGSLKEIAEKEPNNTPKAAQPVTEPAVTINGVLARADVDGFLVTLSAGQTLVAAADANTRLGSPMDAILQVASPDGIVLADNHDAVGLDPRLVFTATKSGMYIVRLFAFPATPDSTIAFRGGDDYIYRLTLTTGPYLSHATPLTAPIGEPGVARLHGWNLPSDVQLPIQPLGGEPMAGFAELEPLGDLRAPSDARWGFVYSPDFGGESRIRLVPHETVATIPQANAENPFAIAVPTSLTGCLAAPKQKDVYQVSLTKGQAILVTVDAKNLDFPVDPVVQLLDPKGESAAEADDTARNRDVALTHTAKQDGNYKLVVTDRYRHGSPFGFYRLTVRPDDPDFELTAAADTLTISPGKPTELTVNIQRRSGGGKSIGPITISADDLPAGVEMPAVVSEVKGATSSKVTLKFTAAGPAYSGPIRLAGSTNEPQELRRAVRTPMKLAASWDHLWLTVTAAP